MPWCASCGQFAAEGARFCPACGAQLPSGPAAGQLTRKTLTILFSDVTGFTELGERLDHESVHQVMARFFTEMAEVIARHGGMIEKFIGDEVMAVFGLPVVHEDDALRAARAAVEMRTRLEALGEELVARWNVRLTAHTGLNTGEVVAGVGANGDPVTYGDPVNVAQRLEGAAAPGEILIGATTAQLLRERARITPMTPLPLKGKPELVEAWRLEAADADERVQRAAASERPLIGRDDELQHLREALEAAIRLRQPAVMTLIGAAGIGKSRLAQALIDDAAAQATVVAARCLSYGEGTTFYPLAEIVRRLVTAPEQRAIAELVVDHDDGAEITSRVARVVGFSRGSVTTEEARWAIRRLLEIQASRRPLIVVIDDLHWAEPTLLDLIVHVVTSAAEVPLVWLLLARPELLERRPRWGREAGRSRLLRLGALAEDHASDLVAGLAGGALSPGEHELLLATAAGNPFFLEQLVASRLEAGDAPARTPPTIQALLAARIDALPHSERDVLDRAAVEGRNFHRGALSALLPAAGRDDLDQALAGLERRELIRRAETELPGEVGYRFAHVLVRDVAYDLLSKAARAALHEAYANWLEQELGGAYPEIVGYHLEQALRCHSELLPGAGAQHVRLARRAGASLETAGHAAIERGDLQAGVNLLHRAADLLPETDSARGAILPELGIALVQLGSLAEAQDVLDGAIARAKAAREAVAEAHAVSARFFARVQVSSHDAVAELELQFKTLQRVFTSAHDELGLARLWRAQALVHWLAGQSSQAEAAWTRAVAYARRGGDEQGAADALCWLASAACEGPTPVPEAIRRCEEILAELKGNRRSQALAMRPLAILYAMAERIDDPRSLLDRSNAILADLGVGLTGSARHDEAVVALLGGDTAGAECALKSGYAALEEMGERAFLATTTSMLARALYLRGNFEEALAFANQAEKTAAADDLSAQILWRTARAQVLAQRDELSAASALSAEAVRLASITDWLNDRADALLVHGEILRALGDSAAAEETRKEAVALYERKGNVIAVSQARAIDEHALMRRTRRTR
jgi:class 3 adenylate cyclase/tetratricopeptide (TPR) repeat protein